MQERFGGNAAPSAHQPLISLSVREKFVGLAHGHHPHSVYSITSSARASNVGGTSTPSALAVLRLMVRLYLVGA